MIIIIVLETASRAVLCTHVCVCVRVVRSSQVHFDRWEIGMQQSRCILNDIAHQCFSVAPSGYLGL